MTETFTIKIVNTYSADNNKTYTEKSLQKDIDRAFKILEANPNIIYDITGLKVTTEVAESDDDETAVYSVVFKFTVPVFEVPEQIIQPKSNRLKSDGADNGVDYVPVDIESELLEDLASADIDAVAIHFVIILMSEQWLSAAGLPPLPEVLTDASVEQKLCLLENISERYVPEYTIDDVEMLLALGEEDEV